MDDLFKEIRTILDKVKKDTCAVHRALAKLPAAVSVSAFQRIQKQAKEKLKSSFPEYMRSVRVSMEDSLLVVELDKDSWLANAVEEGASPFDMRGTILSSSKAKVSAKGFKYMTIPMSISKTKGSEEQHGTDKSQEYQQKLREIVENRPEFGKPKYNIMPDGAVSERQGIKSKVDDLTGLFRTRKHSSMSSLQSGKSRPKWNYVLFRKISDNPELDSKDSWKHPGITPVRIFKATEAWLNSEIDNILNELLNSELNR